MQRNPIFPSLLLLACTMPTTAQINASGHTPPQKPTTKSSKPATPVKPPLPYNIVDTGQIRCYSNNREIAYPKTGASFWGQDGQINGNQPAYRNNGNGTITDLHTGLMWQQDPGTKKVFKQAVAGAKTCRVGGYKDWRLPTIKELYSLIQFNGTDPDPRSSDTASQKPFIDTNYFKFKYGNANQGERIIDSQFATCTKYVSTTMGGNETMFGVNFADGRIKGYPISSRRRGRDKGYYVLYVRDNPNYGKNKFKDNKDGTVTDLATGLTWMQVDSGSLRAGKDKDGKLNWQEALKWAADLKYAGHKDWRLPNVKELQSLVDYSRSPDTSKSPAIDPIFQTTAITGQTGKKDYPFFWSGTTHASASRCSTGSYVAFGRGGGWMTNRRTGQRQLQDVHGAGCQRSDPKAGDPKQFPYGRGPQGDVIRIYNFVRCVRGGIANPRTKGPAVEKTQVPPTRRGEGGRRGRRKSGREGHPPTGADFIRRLDKNGDGKVTKNEFDGPPHHFKVLDRNQDGYLSADEAPTGPPRRRNR